MADQVVSYAVSGKDDGASAMFTNVGASIERVEKKVATTEKSIEKLSSEMDKYTRNAVQTTRQSEQLAVGFSRMSDVSKIALGNLAAMGTAKIGQFLVNTISGTYEYVNKLQDLSDSLGVNTQDLQIFSSWAEQSGTTVDGVAKAIGKLETEISKSNPELKKMGITALDGKEAFLQVVAAMDKAQNQAEKVRIANAAFGKGWQEVMPLLKQGSENLREIASATALIDDDTIRDITEMDDKLASMKTNAQALAAQLIAAFGPITSEALEYWAGKLKKFNDAASNESDEDFLRRVGVSLWGSKSRPNMKFQNGVFDPTKRSSDDLAKVIEIRNKVRDAGGSIYEGNYSKTLEIYYRDALVKERKDAAKKRADELERIRKEQEALNIANGLNADGSPKTKAQAQDKSPDYRILSDMAWLSKNGTSSPDTDQQVAVDRGLAWLAKNGSSGIDSDAQAAYDRYRLGWNGESNFRSNDRAAAIRKLQGYGLVGENGVGVIDTTDMSLEELQEQIRNTEEAIEGMEDKSVSAAERINDAFADIAGSSLKELNRDLAHLAVQGELTAKTIGDAIEKSILGALEDVLATLLDIGSEMALKAIFAGTGAEGFITRICRHADGTFNSPGGIGTLSERGIENVITPQGNSYYVTPGLYAMSPGARVIPAEATANAPQRLQNLTFVFEGQNPMLNSATEQRIRAIIREEYAGAGESARRTRVR